MNQGQSPTSTVAAADQHVQILVETHTHPSAEQKSLLERFAELSGEQTHPATKTLFEKVRELFS